MTLPERYRDYWAGFEALRGAGCEERFYEAFHFDDSERVANELAALVLAGRKRATASLLWVCEMEQKPVPAAGDLSIVTDWAGEPLCIIESWRVEVVPYAEVTEAFAAREGEGDLSLDYWRRVHWEYFSRECERIGRSPVETMPVVCESFEVVYSEATGCAE